MYHRISKNPEHSQGGTPRKWIGKLISQVDHAKKDAILAKGDNGMVKKSISKTSQKKVVSGTHLSYVPIAKRWFIKMFSETVLCLSVQGRVAHH